MIFTRKDGGFSGDFCCEFQGGYSSSHNHGGWLTRRRDSFPQQYGHFELLNHDYVGGRLVKLHLKMMKTSCFLVEVESNRTSFWEKWSPYSIFFSRRLVVKVGLIFEEV